MKRRQTDKSNSPDKRPESPVDACLG
jgi:hypothetical protein